MKNKPVYYDAFIEYGRSMKSRAELKKMEQGFRADKVIAENFVELKGRKFLFRFESSVARILFLKNMEKLFKKHKEKAIRDGW